MRMRFLLAAMAGVALTSCGRSPSPPAVVSVPAVAPDKPDPANPAPALPATKADPAPAADGGSFAFPDDTGGKALAKMLTPATPPPMPASAPPRPRDRKLPAFLDAPEPPLPDAANTPPQLALPPIQGVRPTALPERVPPDLGGSTAELPSRPETPAGALVRTPARDVSAPATLSILSSKPVLDRAPLTDPTAEFTAKSVISPSLPLRTVPAGFIRINLPDPFENVGAAKVQTPVIENPNRVLPR
jgi:hypothetical protein